MTPCGAPAPDTVRPEPDRQAKPGPPWRCMSPRTGTCCVRRRCCASCPRSPWRRVSLPSGHELVRRAVAARRRRHSTRPADKGALVTPQPAVICARLHAQTPTPAPQPTRSSDATGRCLWKCTRGPLTPSRETGVIRFCVATQRRSVVRQTFSLAWPMRARPWTACARASSTADTEPTIDVLINNAGRMLVTCWKDVAGDDTRESSHFGGRARPFWRWQLGARRRAHPVEYGPRGGQVARPRRVTA